MSSDDVEEIVEKLGIPRDSVLTHIFNTHCNIGKDENVFVETEADFNANVLRIVKKRLCSRVEAAFDDSVVKEMEAEWVIDDFKKFLHNILYDVVWRAYRINVDTVISRGFVRAFNCLLYFVETFVFIVDGKVTFFYDFFYQKGVFEKVDAIHTKRRKIAEYVKKISF